LSYVEFIVELLSATIGMSTPFLLAALGEAYAERSGILNLGIEGIMLLGAVIGYIGARAFNNLWIGVFLAILVGGLMGIFMGFLSISIRANQVISGLMIGIFCTGTSIFIHKVTVGITLEAPRVETFKPVHIPVLSEIPIVGPILFMQDPMALLTLILVPIAYIILFKTDLGLKIRAVGENPKAADTLGVNVYIIRYVCIVFAGMLAGMAGAYLPLARVGMFTEGMTAGRGWIALAIVIFGRWDPWKILIGCFLFGGADALQLRLQTGGFGIPSEFLLMLPYILTIALLVFVYKGAGAPAALGISYKREET